MRSIQRCFILFFVIASFGVSLSPAYADEYISKEAALRIAFESAEKPIENMFQTALDENIISTSYKNTAHENISFIAFLKISLKSHGFVDVHRCALRGNLWYTPFLEAALAHNIITAIPDGGKISAFVSLSNAEKILANIKKKKDAINHCLPHKKMVSNAVNFRIDAGNYGQNKFEKISDGSEVLKIGNPILGKPLWYDGKYQNKWQSIYYNGNIGFVLPSFVSEDIIGKKFESKGRDFTIFELEGRYTEVCKNIYIQPLKKYRVKGESKIFTGGLLVLKKGNAVQFIRSEFSEFYQKNGGPCGSIGYPVSASSRFGHSPQEIQQSFVSQYDNFKKRRNGFEESKIGWSQKFSSGKTLYNPNESDDFYFLKTNLSNCVFDLSRSQICCESPRGKMCHHAVSGGGYAYNGHYRTNNSDWEWHHTLLFGNDIAGPIPRGEYHMQYRGGACKFKHPFLHFTCISYLLHKGSSSRIHPPAGAVKPNGEKADFREEIFFHPSFSSGGCITFSDHLEPWDNASKWLQQIPKWKIVTDILDGGKIYGRGYMGGGFIGKMVVTE